MAIERRSRKGAWIEIYSRRRGERNIPVAPVRERGLKFLLQVGNGFIPQVAPVRERGLKLLLNHQALTAQMSLP